jgi:hypothetical protein
VPGKLALTNHHSNESILSPDRTDKPRDEPETWQPREIGRIRRPAVLSPSGRAAPRPHVDVEAAVRSVRQNTPPQTPIGGSRSE